MPHVEPWFALLDNVLSADGQSFCPHNPEKHLGRSVRSVDFGKGTSDRRGSVPRGHFQASDSARGYLGARHKTKLQPNMRFSKVILGLCGLLNLAIGLCHRPAFYAAGLVLSCLALALTEDEDR